MVNNYMKFTGILFLWVFFIMGASAQWNPDLSRNLRISQEEEIDQDLVSLGETSDGGVYVSWISWEKECYYLKLQLLDKEGRCRFASGGIYVCKQPTPTWSSGYGCVVTRDDNLVLISTDMRNGEWQAYAYKISPEGEQVWSPEGVALMKSGEGAALAPRVIETESGNYIIGYRSMGNGPSRLCFLKYAADGTSLWGGKLEITGAGDLFNLVPSGNDGFIVSYFENDNYYAQKYSATGDEVWEERAEIDNSELVKTTSEPCVVSDGQGGIVAGWRYAASAYTTGGKVQHVDAGGKCTFAEPVTTGNLPLVSVAPSAGSIYIFSSNPVATNLFDPRVWNVDYQGNHLWGSRGVILSEEGLSYAAYGISRCTNGDVICVFRNGTDYNAATIEYTRIDPQGDVKERNKVVSDAPGDKGRGAVTTVRDGQIIAAWTDNSSKAGGVIFAQNMKVEDPADIRTSMEMGADVTSCLADGGCLKICIQSETETVASVRLTGMDGGLSGLWPQEKLSRGNNELIYALNGIPEGVYLLSVETRKGNRHLRVVVH